MSNDSSPPVERSVAAPADQPLGLTVHNLPDAHASGAWDARRTRSGRWKMLLVLMVCAAPVIASYVTYYFVRPEGRRVFGELIEPQRPMPAIEATALDGTPVRLRTLRGQWLIVTVAGGACDRVCEQNLYLQRQVREGLGKDKERVDRVWLLDDGAPVGEGLRQAMRDAQVLRVDPAALARWLAPAPGERLGAHLYLVDPMGNWMMRFPAGLDVSGAARMKRDLERLLRASASWDTAGRQP